MDREPVTAAEFLSDPALLASRKRRRDEVAAARDAILRDATPQFRAMLEAVLVDFHDYDDEYGPIPVAEDPPVRGSGTITFEVSDG